MTIADWLWMNFLQCFRKSPDLCCTKPSQKLSDIGNCPRGGSQNNWQTNTSWIERRVGKSFWDATNSMEMNFSAPSLLKMKLGCTWVEKDFQPTRRGEVDEGVRRKLLWGRHQNINSPVHHLHWEEWWLCRKISYICTNVTRFFFVQIKMFVTYKNSLHLLSGHALYKVQNLHLVLLDLSGEVCMTRD